MNGIIIKNNNNNSQKNNGKNILKKPRSFSNLSLNFELNNLNSTIQNLKISQF